MENLVVYSLSLSVSYFSRVLNTAPILRDSFESQVQELFKQIKDKENELTLIDEQHAAVIKEKDAKITSLHQNIEVLQNDVYLRDQQRVRQKFILVTLTLENWLTFPRRDDLPHPGF